jgi:hypothetical protein
MEFNGELLFDSGLSSEFFCSFDLHHQQWAILGGKQGFIRVDDYVLPVANRNLQYDVMQADFVLDECQFEMRQWKSTVVIDESPNNAPDAQETKLFRRFSQLVIDRTLDDFWFDVAWRTQVVLDACMQSARHGGNAVMIDPVTHECWHV